MKVLTIPLEEYNDLLKKADFTTAISNTLGKGLILVEKSANFRSFRTYSYPSYHVDDYNYKVMGERDSVETIKNTIKEIEEYREKIKKEADRLYNLGYNISNLDEQITTLKAKIKKYESKPLWKRILKIG